jgi:hypothetical protein
MSSAIGGPLCQEVRKRHLASNAMKKLETGWAKIRKNVFGSTKKG